MRTLFLLLVAGHGLIHLMGFAKAFGLAELPQLTQPVSRGAGVAWLAAASLILGAVAMAWSGSRHWWVPGLLGAAVSQAVIATAWGDAKFGTVGNVILLIGVFHALATSVRPPD